MGNGHSRDEFADVLPCVEVPGKAKLDPSLISDAWTGGSSSSSAGEDDAADSSAKTLVGKFVPPCHALQQEENISRRSVEASEVVRVFNAVERTEDRFLVPESVRKSRTLDTYADVCSEILPGFLYVSNLRVARDTVRLRVFGITHVINCCGELKCYENDAETSRDVEDTMRLLLRDDATEDLTPFLPQVMEYIATCRQRSQSQDKETGNGAKVLVHCHQGVSRSCALAIAYVMLEQQLSYHEASALVKRQRAISSPNAAFICQLLEWEKDLQAIRAREHGAPGFALGGLYRLTSHASYDPECFVLKRCYEPSAGSARQRQNMANVRTQDDERRLLWSQGTFVYQSPTTSTDLIVWHGAKCTILDAVSRATKLSHQLLGVQALAQTSDTALIQMKLVEVFESSEGQTGTDVDHFGYTAELHWSRELVPKVPQLLLPINGGTKVTNNGSDQLEIQPTNVVSVPQLFILEAIGERDGDDLWDQLTNYDSEDLTPDGAFLVFSVKSQRFIEGYVWIGTSCQFAPEMVVKAAQKHVQSLHTQPETSSSSALIIEHQNQESDAFWQLFEAGY